MSENLKISLYVGKLTIVIAGVLAVLYNFLEPITESNKKAAKKKAILSCVLSPEQLASMDVNKVFEEKIEYFVVKEDGTRIDSLEGEGNVINTKGRKHTHHYTDRMDVNLITELKMNEEDRIYPVYIFTNDEGKKMYIVNVLGKGLWDKIWGYIALDMETKTVIGVSFDHKGETPGLGAEIKDSKDFVNAFKGKKVFDAKQEVALAVSKKVKQPEYQVQAISGATITSDGVSKMLKLGINKYNAYFSTL